MSEQILTHLNIEPLKNMSIHGLGFDPNGSEYLDSIENDFPIDFAAAVTEGRKDREKRDKEAMAARDKIRQNEQDEDFWKDDPYFEELCIEYEAAEAHRVWEEGEKIREAQEYQFEQIEKAPLRHLRKNR